MSACELMDHLPEIAARIEQSTAILVGLDLDGTLTAIRPRPKDVVLEPRVREILGRLSNMDRVIVAIVSGRSLVDVRQRVNLPGLVYAGNHGLEIHGPGIDRVDPAAAALADRLAVLTNEIQTRLGHIAGAEVEAKGLTTSIHYRNVGQRQRDELDQIVRQAVDREEGRFIVSSGRRIWEILPRESWHKGDAMKWISSRLGGPPPLVFYLGDDRTDENAFAALPEAVTVKIGDGAGPTKARYALADPEAVHRFLHWLARRFPPGEYVSMSGRDFTS